MVDVQKLLEEARRDWQSLDWEGTFEEYLNMVTSNPALARRAHARIYDMIQWTGALPGPEEVPQYDLFANEIFGLDRALDRLVQFFHAAARGLEVRKRILLLMGPPASGKSSIVTLLKAGLERYGRTEQGATYAIKGCPMQEDPLHLIPNERRQDLAQDYGHLIEGDLCPRCRYSLRHEYGGDVAKVRVQRIGFSQSAGVGMGSFVATSAQSQDIARLIGTVDMSQMGGDRLDGAGKGLRLDGELQAANRGIMEFIEIFKSDERFLTVVLGVTQEQVIKLGSFGSVYADEAIIAHTNEEEYNAFVNNKETAAFLDRIILVKVPYNLQMSQEERIYSSMLPHTHPTCSEEPPEDSLRIAPLSLRVAAVLSVLSRLEAVDPGSGQLRVSPIEKLKLYDGQVLSPYTRTDVDRLQEECPREGMFGLSPRYVINRLADALTREKACLTPRKALKSLVDGLIERAGMSKDEQARISALVQEAAKEYRDLALREVQKAAVKDFGEKASELFHSYVRDAEAFCDAEEAESGAISRPDERVLRRLESVLGLKDAERPRFRREVSQSYRYFQQRPDLPGPGYDSIPALRVAIEDTLLARREEVRYAIDPRPKNPERVRAREEIFERLISGHGYCRECADDLIDFAYKTLRGKGAVTLKRGKMSWD